jgi:hypothetical protein
MTDKLIEHRRRILIPATFGVHSMIHDELLDYISQTFGHSTFSFHEVFLDRPVTWQQTFDARKMGENTVYETTQPFLSRFVHQSGLTPRVDKGVVHGLSEIMKVQTEFDPLAIPLVATTKESYHQGLEKITFPLGDSIFLQGLLQIWLKIEQGKEFKPDEWRDIDDWKTIFTNDAKHIQPTVGVPISGLGRPVSLIGSLCSDKIKNWYGDRVRQKLEDVIGEKKEFSELAKEEKKKKKRQYATKVKVANDAILALLREYHIALRPWIEARENSPVVVVVSISSDALFWGECVVILPGVDGDSKKFDHLKAYEGISEILIKNVQRTFMPIMTIFENYLLEYQLKESWKDWRKSSDWKRLQGSTKRFSFPKKFLRFDANWITNTENINGLQWIGMGYEPQSKKVEETKIGVAGLTLSDSDDHLFLLMLCNCFNDRNWTTKLNDLERGLTSLWAARYSVLCGDLPSNGSEVDKLTDAMKIVEDSFVFEKYLVASPAILNSIVTAMGLRHGDRGEAKASVKTALVIGGPGSGKDAMAKLVRLFSPGYRFGQLITLNMASFRPKEAAVPLLLGLDVFYKSNGSKKAKSFSIYSLLGRAWKPNILNPPYTHGKGLAFIFDELNSLDMDTQGALLRFLESGELLSLGSFEPVRDIDALVIGVMNEDPYTITKARTLDRVLRDKQVFGGMLGDFLYEFFRGKRRLRDDLYFRMIRGGEIILPELRDRREDIPVLFHFIVEKDLMPSIQEKKWEIELSTYELLMDPSLQWEGNVRQLQTLAREVFRVAYDEFKGHRRHPKNGPTRLTLRGTHVRTAQQNLARKSPSHPEMLVQST